jgi:hypothetical protein
MNAPSFRRLHERSTTQSAAQPDDAVQNPAAHRRLAAELNQTA